MEMTNAVPTPNLSDTVEMIVGDERIRVTALLAETQRRSSDWVFQCRQHRASGAWVLSDKDGRYYTRAEFESAVIRLRKFYEGVPDVDDLIEKTNRDAAALSMLEEFFIDAAPDHSAGTVYVIQGNHGYCKIGKTENLPARLRSLSTASPFELQVLMTFKSHDMGWLEAVLHKRYAAKRLRGEWFELSEEDIAELRNLSRVFVDP